MNTAGAGDDPPDSPLRFKGENRRERFTCTVNLFGVDTSKCEFGAGTSFVAERPVFRTSVLEQIERGQSLGLCAFLFVVKAHVGAGRVVPLLCR